jgi:hypothetical protein
LRADEQNVTALPLAGYALKCNAVEGVQRFGVTRKQEEQFKDSFFKATVTSCIPFNFFDNEYLADAFRAVGM